jgi:hypothetical protein
MWVKLEKKAKNTVFGIPLQNAIVQRLLRTVS